MFRREALTRIMIIPVGNAMGVLLLGLMISPVLFSSSIGVGLGNWGAIVVTITTLAAVMIDLRIRSGCPDPSRLVRLFSPLDGGNLVFIPSWLLGVASLALFAFAMVR